MQFNFSKKFFIVLAVLIAIGFGYGWLQYFLTTGELKKTRKSEIELLENIKDLEEELFRAKEDGAQLSDLLQGEVERNDAFARQIQSITSTVGVLEKLSQTDKELLQKYSRVYFLNENYVPSNLAKIDEKYLFEKNRESLIHANVQKYLYSMMEDADFNGMQLQIISAYRSFSQQGSLKSGYITIYGSGANQFSAEQGYSEHQLGTAVDFTTLELGASFTKIESTSAYKWLLENAHKYGFILSYPKGNTYYRFEPWHWRFVGVNLASELHNRNQYFYDMVQREIDTYLVYIFD